MDCQYYSRFLQISESHKVILILYAKMNHITTLLSIRNLEDDTVVITEVNT